MRKYTKTIKGDYYNPQLEYFEYSFKGQFIWVQGELAFNKEKNRYEHVHLGRRGGRYLIYWNI